VKRLLLLLLSIGVILGLTALPATVFAASMHSMTARVMVKTDMASMPDCQTQISKKASSAPCKCGFAGCIAMAVSGITMLLPDNSSIARSSTVSKCAGPIGPSANLRGRSTVPEPEPPSFLI
jgi:hypothetical protein